MGVIFDGWTAIARVFVVGVLAYASLVLLLRLSGKRTLSKMNAFDFVVTVALGSTLATILLSKEVSVATGASALAVLIGLQYSVAWLAVRFRFVRRLVKSEPRLLVHRGELLDGAMREERVSKDEVLAAIRQEGLAGLKDVGALVLETDGMFSVIAFGHSESNAAVRSVRGYRRNDDGYSRQ